MRRHGQEARDERSRGDPLPARRRALLAVLPRGTRERICGFGKQA